MKKGKIALCAVLALLLSGCATNMGTFSMISTKVIDWSRAAEYQQSREEVEGEDSTRVVFLMSDNPSHRVNSIDGAVQDALDKVPGAVALLDVSVKQIIICIPFIFMKDGYLVKGRALIDPRRADDDGDSSLGEEEP